MTKKISTTKKIEYEAIGKLLESTYLANSEIKAKVLWFTFLRGLFYGLGIFLAGTLVIGIIISILNVFNEVPIIGPFIENIINSLNSPPSKI
jgi:hypothetical protein